MKASSVIIIFYVLDVNVGFVRTTIEVSETIGSVDVCLQILNPTSEEDLDTSLHVTLVTESVTATSKTKINNYNIFCVLIERVVAIFY